ncbi:MAG: hypothetical protein C3F17_06500 [Bradyrhizobiaceae bacterium]|nr:MAG: hypothetical protein C3F17_06500 [Bradyrhizobiaceae bacterium]
MTEPNLRPVLEAETRNASGDSSRKLRQGLLTVLRAVVSIGLLWLVARRLSLADLQERSAALSTTALLVAAVILALVTILSSLRWRKVCASTSGRIGLISAWRVLMISTAMDQFVFTMSGDAFRIWWLTGRSPSLTHALGSTVLDRIVGVFGLILLMAAGLPALMLSEAAGSLIWVPVAMSTAGLAGLGLLLALPSLPLPAFPLKGNLLLISLAARRLFFRPHFALPAIAAAVGVHLGVALAIAAIGSAIGVSVSFVWYLLVTPSVLMVTLLPISIGGWGVREAAMVVGLGIAGVGHNDALLISVVFGLLVAGIGVAGVLTWLFGIPGRS